MRNDENFYGQYWAERNQRFERAKAHGHVIWLEKGGRIQVSAPYDEVFRVEALKLDGKWRPKSGLWSFPQLYRREVRALIDRIYGEERIKEWAS